MVSRVIRHLVMSDFVLNFAFGLLSPIFAVFILKNIQGGDLKVIGLATTFYWIARTATTVPLSRFMDRTNGERDEFYFIVGGSFIMSSVPLFYLFASLPWHIYLIELLLGLANSMAVPAWRILFTDHIDRGRTGFYGRWKTSLSAFRWLLALILGQFWLRRSDSESFLFFWQFSAIWPP